MILSGSEIRRQVEAGRIVIDPFDPRQLNPNSYNYRLAPEVKAVPSDLKLDPRHDCQLCIRTIPPAGLILEPGRLYLGRTKEVIGSEFFVPSLIGRSSVGRLGLYLQISADLGNLGFVDSWTLELVAIQAIRIYPDMIIGQVSFWKPTGPTRLYNGKYTSQDAPVESRFKREFEP